MQFQQAISVSIVLASLASVGAQDFTDFTVPLASPFEPAGPSFDAVLPAPATPLEERYSFSLGPPPPPAPRAVSSVYGRIDYFRWQESIGGRNVVTETGPQWTIGFQRRVGQQRLRGDFFGGQVNYDGFAQFPDGSLDPLSNVTNYTGLRGEYDLLFDPAWWPAATLFCGVGTKLWSRDMPDSRSASGAPVSGYRESWWTTYPYLGVQTRRELTDGSTEFYTAGRAGLTAVTFEHVTWNDAALNPKPGFTGQIEAGIRGSRLSASAFGEVMTWGQSDVQRQLLQPASTLLTVGLRWGVIF